MTRLLCALLLLAAACLSIPGQLTPCEEGCVAPRVCHKGYCLMPDNPIVDAGPLAPPDAGPPINPATCGNAEVERGEACDDGNQDEMDACTSACRWRLQAVGGGGHSCFRKGGRLFCAGRNERGQLGDGTQRQRTAPMSVVNVGTVVDVVGLAEATCALNPEGTVKCWGHCGFGVLGPDHVDEDGQGCDEPLPQTIAGITDGTHLAAGDWFVCVRSAQGRALCWGRNAFGSLGRGSAEESSTPAPVIGLDDVADLSAGAYHACALSYAGAVRCWGANDRGQLGLGDETQRLEPSSPVVDNVQRLAAGSYHTCVLTTDNKVSCWGFNEHGELGVGTHGAPSFVPLEVPSASQLDVRGLYGANRHTCLMTTAGTLYCTGSDSNGQLGIGDQSPDPDSPSFLPTQLSVLHLAAGSRDLTSFAVSPDNYFWVWGKNEHGQLGLGDQDDRHAPTCLALDGQFCPINP